MTRVAAIDCGTNSIRLLISDIDSTEQSAVDVVREMRIVRLGQGIDATGEFAPEALERTFAACAEYAELIRQHMPGANRDTVRFVATSASRDARNRAEFIAGVEGILGVTPEVISGEEEAGLSFIGATRGLQGLVDPVCVVDIGGGSTEFVVGQRSGDIDAAISMNIGCVRMTERHFSGIAGQQVIPVTAADAARVDIDEAIGTADAAVDLSRIGSLVAVAGSATTVAAMALGLPEYDSEAIHASIIGADGVLEASRRFLSMTTEERAALPYMAPGRADVIAAGALVLSRIVSLSGVPDVVISERDILDGIAWGIAEKQLPARELPAN